MRRMLLSSVLDDARFCALAMGVADTAKGVVQMPSLRAKRAPTARTTSSARRRKPILRHPSDLRTLGFTGLFYGCLLTLWWYETQLLSAGPQGWLAWGVLFGMLYMLAAMMAVISHNALHVPVFHSSKLQKLFQLALTGAYGQPVSVYQPGHNRSHHRHTGTRQDLMRSTKLQYERNWLNILLSKEHAPGATGGLRLAVNFYKVQWNIRRDLVYTFLIELAFTGLVLFGTAILSPRKCLLYVYGAHMAGQTFINSINYLQHDGCDVDPGHKGYNHARNFTGWFFNYIFLNNGYHTIHHMKPGLHWSVLPDHHARSVAPKIHPNLCVPCFRKHLWRALWVREDYLGRPVVPGDDSRDWSTEDEDIVFDTKVVFETDPAASEPTKPHTD